MRSQFSIVGVIELNLHSVNMYVRRYVHMYVWLYDDISQTLQKQVTAYSVDMHNVYSSNALIHLVGHQYIGASYSGVYSNIE